MTIHHIADLLADSRALSPRDLAPWRAAFTPDPDDAFAWRALATGELLIDGRRVETEAIPIDRINQACRDRQAYDIAAVSSAAYPLMADHYALLSPGASVGRGYGPALASRTLKRPEDILREDVVVAVPGDTTTGAMLLRLFFPGVQTVAMTCDEVAGALLSGEVQAGVLIHEELLNLERKGLRRLACLGAMWTDKTGLPIPVGLNVVRRDLGAKTMQEVAAAIRESMEIAERQRADASAWAMGFTNQAAEGIGEKYLAMFANEDTLDLADDCLLALRTLWAMAENAGLIDTAPALEVIGRRPRLDNRVAAEG
jgi:1,4-dihydroxy-6-naphthoate synthase